MRKPLKAVVCYIPEISPFHKDIDGFDIREWAIRTEDGLIRAFLYLPEKVQPSPKILFLERGSPSDVQLDPNL
jgi:hypothetical protein